MSEDGNMKILGEIIDCIRSMRMEAGVLPEQSVSVRFDGSFYAEQVISDHKQMLADLAGVDSMEFASSPQDTQFHRSTASFDVGLILAKEETK